MSRVLLAVSLLCLVVAPGVFAQALPAPTNLTAEQINDFGVSVRLTWQAPDSIMAFRVYRSANDTNHYQPIGGTNAGTGRTFTDHMVMVGTRYFYFVRALRGNLMSDPSNVADILITPPPPPPPPPTPTNLTATLVPGGLGWHGPGVQLMWNGGVGPWTYRIFRSADDTSHFMMGGSTRDTSFLDFEVQAGTHYFYYVKAFGMNGGESGRSNFADIVVVAPPRIQGTIRGTVIDDSTMAPIRNVFMQFFRLSGPSINCFPVVVTDSLGHYSALLDTGRYIVRANPRCEHNTTCYRPEYYNNCPEPSCATVITVAESSMFVANFGLSRPTPPTFATVSGSVKDTLNQPIRRARVSLIRTVRQMNFLASLGFVPGTGDEEFNLEGVGRTRGVIWTGWADSLGNYQARVIEGQSYFALASKEGFLPQYFDHKATVETADTIFVTRDTSGINFNLSVRPVPNNSVSGNVRDSSGTGVVSRIVLLPARFGHPGPAVTRYFHTDSLGNYTITGVEAGQYFVLAIPFSDFAPGFYKANACGIIHIQDADTVNITGNVTGINICVADVEHNGLTVLRGTIRSTANSPVVGVRVTGLDMAGNIAAIGMTDARGMYELDAVAPGLVTVSADREGYNAAQLPVTVTVNTYSMDNVNITMTPSSVTSVGDPGAVPTSFALNQNYPNPFNPTTQVSYALSAPGVVSLQIYNVLGQVVATLVNGNSAAGTFNVTWNGKDDLGRPAASGVYIYRLHATSGTTEFTQARKMLLLK